MTSIELEKIGGEAFDEAIKAGPGHPHYGSPEEAAYIAIWNAAVKAQQDGAVLEIIVE
mgnify:CR=1 FL=1